MKFSKLLSIAALILATAMLFSSCSKDDNTESNAANNSTEIPEGTIRAKVNGVLKTANNFVSASISSLEFVQ
jgi:hypothetical protein